MVVIDKHKLYQSREYCFKNFIMMNDDEKLMVLNWRNDDRVRRWMYSKKQATEEEHFNFINTLEGRKDRWYWLVYRREIPVGVLVLSLQDIENEIFESGTYMNPELYGEGFGFFKEVGIFLYYVLGINSIYSSVQADNKDALYLNLFLGVKYVEKKYIPQDGKDVAYYFSLPSSKESFAPYKDATLGEYARFVKKIRNGIIDMSSFLLPD